MYAPYTLKVYTYMDRVYKERVYKVYARYSQMEVYNKAYSRVYRMYAKCS